MQKNPLVFPVQTDSSQGLQPRSFPLKPCSVELESELVIQHSSDWQMLFKRDRLRVSSLPS